MKIKFTDVGRDKWNGEIEVPQSSDAQDISEIAYGVALKHLASKYPDTEYDAETNIGEIFSGYRCVGKFEVVK